VKRYEVCDILEALADGIDPLTGQALPDASPYHHPRVLRALYSALLELRSTTPDAGGDKQPSSNAGKPWSLNEDARLAEDFDAEMSIAELAEKHRRSRGAIRSRLVRLGKLAPSEDHPA
jgi:hypothetical protein